MKGKQPKFRDVQRCDYWMDGYAFYRCGILDRISIPFKRQSAPGQQGASGEGLEESAQAERRV